jgi:hypothetical protein
MRRVALKQVEQRLVPSNENPLRYENAVRTGENKDEASDRFGFSGSNNLSDMHQSASQVALVLQPG